MHDNVITNGAFDEIHFRSEYYEPYAKQSKIIKVFNRYGVDGLEELIPKDELKTLINERIKLYSNVWINASVLICMYHEDLYLVRYLLQFIANEETIFEGYGFERLHLLHLLCLTDIMDSRVEYYIREYNVDINILDPFGRNCLFHVQMPEMYNYLISKGADKQIRDQFGYSPIFYMFVCKKEDMAMQLIDDDIRKELAKFIIEEARSDRYIWMPILEKIVQPTPEFADAFLFMAIETYGRGCSTVYLKVAGIYERDPMALLDIFDTFITQKRGYDSTYRLDFLTKQYKIGDMRYICYKRWLDTLIQHPVSNSYVIYSYMMDYIGEFCEQTENYMDYMHDVMKVLDQWTFINHWKFDTKYMYAMCWVYNCWLREQEVIPYLQRLLTESERVILEFLDYQTHKKVEFIRFCLDKGGLPVNFQYKERSLLNYCVECIRENATTKVELCELLLSYGAEPHNNTDRCFYSKLVKLLGRDVPNQQCCCFEKK